MTTNLTEEERAVWKDAYALHERIHDMQNTESDWRALVDEYVRLAGKWEKGSSVWRLAILLLTALYDYMSQEMAIRMKEELAKPPEPEQMSFGDIPWN